METESILAVEYIFPFSKKGFMTPLSSLKPLEGFALMNNISYVECLCDFHGVITPLPPNFDALRLLLSLTKVLLHTTSYKLTQEFETEDSTKLQLSMEKRVLERNVYIGHNML